MTLAGYHVTPRAALWGRGWEREHWCWLAWMEPRLCLPGAVRPQVSFLTFLCLGFHICKVGILIGLLGGVHDAGQ